MCKSVCFLRVKSPVLQLIWFSHLPMFQAVMSGRQAALPNQTIASESTTPHFFHKLCNSPGLSVPQWPSWTPKEKQWFSVCDCVRMHTVPLNTSPFHTCWWVKKSNEILSQPCGRNFSSRPSYLHTDTSTSVEKGTCCCNVSVMHPGVYLNGQIKSCTTDQEVCSGGP